MNILFISHRIPYPPNKGDKIRSFNEIKYLAQKHNIYLAFLVDDEKDLSHLDELRRYCIDFDFDVIKPRWQKFKSVPYLLTKKPLSVPYFYSKKLQATIDKRLVEAKIDVVVCFSSPMAEYLFRSKIGRLDENERPRLIMDFVDVDSDKWRMYSSFSKFPFSALYRREWRCLMRYERKIGCAFDRSIFVSDREVELFKSFCPEADTVSVPNGVDLDFYGRDPAGQPGEFSMKSSRKNILFTGAMDYFPNEDAVAYFSTEIWPHVKKEMPEVTFYIVGGKPSARVRNLSKKDPEIVVTGYVPDIRPYLRRADVVVAPLRISRGVQNKVLEAIAAGVPVVARPEAVHGLSGYNGSIKVEQDSMRFALAILDILNMPHARRQSVCAVKEFVKKNHDWGENLKKWDNLLQYKETC